MVGVAFDGVNVTTWERARGEGWTAIATEPPTARDRGVSLVFDSWRGVVTMFGGRRGDATWFNDTWTWDGATWTNVVTPIRPPRREDHMTTFDDHRGELVVFGGWSAAGSELDDTWLFDGTAWRSVPLATHPTGRIQGAFAYDAQAGSSLLVGGFRAAFNAYATDAWRWDGEAWSPADLDEAPALRRGGSLVYDPLRRRSTLFCGTAFASFEDTWHFASGDGQPEETCLADADADLDGHAGCDDPDCWPLCTPTCPPGAPCVDPVRFCGDGACGGAESCAVCVDDCGPC
jgi:hypothetical protein